MPDQIEISFFIFAIVLTSLFTWALVKFWKKSRSEEAAILSRETHHNLTGGAAQAADSHIGEKTGTSVTVVQEPPPRSLTEALSGTQKWLWGRIKSSLLESSPEKELEKIEEILYTSDLGSNTVELVMSRLKRDLSSADLKNDEKVRGLLKSQFLEIFGNAEIAPLVPLDTQDLSFSAEGPKVWMIVGVNGAGKTTSIGKLASLMAKQGKKVLVAAGDTFRAAAGNQLKEWTDRAQVDIYSPPQVTDPSAVGFEALSKAVREKYDLLIVDTAGRLHTQAPLMEELKKMKKVLAKVSPSAPHETLIVLDANSGQNALLQAHEFHKALGLTGIILTKMDGTAKGGVALGIANEMKIPIRLIGVGEKIEDLRTFSPESYVDSIIQA